MDEVVDNSGLSWQNLWWLGVFLSVLGGIIWILGRKLFPDFMRRMGNPNLQRFFRRNQGYSFVDDIRAGLNSDNFNLLEENLIAGDNRTGLEPAARDEVVKIMNTNHISFDNARALYLKKKMEENNIGDDGRPRDPKAVFFS